jgi:hypothetical protein
MRKNALRNIPSTARDRYWTNSMQKTCNCQNCECCQKIGGMIDYRNKGEFQFRRFLAIMGNSGNFPSLHRY